MMKFVCLINLHSTDSALAGSCRVEGQVCQIKVHDTMQNVGGVFRAAMTVRMFSDVQIILAILGAIFKVIPVSLKF